MILFNRVRITVEFKKEDCWAGVFWRMGKNYHWQEDGSKLQRVHLWVCIVPMLPLHIKWWRRIR